MVKHLKIVITSVLLLVCLSSSMWAQINLRGTDFWLTFGENAPAANTLGSEQSLQIRIVGSEQATTGNIYFTHLDTSISFSIAAGQVYTYNLSEKEKLAVCNEMAGINNLSIHITSSISVTVYALNQRFRSTDATNILPATVLGTDYYQVSYTASNPDAYAVVATQNNTQIYHDGILINTLNTGQVYYHTNRDMTGDYIAADKPVAFFAMSQGVQIPNGTPYIDILFQQLAPVNTWGKSFFVPVSWRGKDFVRIVASQNGTNITQIGGTIRNVSGGQTTLFNLNAGQWVELEISLDSNGCYIQANKPIGVCTYLTSTRYNHPTDELSDPAQAWLPSIEQKINTALIAPFIPTAVTNLNQHYALIITSTATKKNITVKIGNKAEQALSGGKWYDNTVAGMSFYSMPLSKNTDAYLFTNRAGGLLIMGYGMGIAESYYYLSFSAMRSLDAAFYVNNIHYQDLSSENICTQPAQFHAKLEGDISKKVGYLKWYINDVEEVTARDKRSWSKTLAPDTYNIKIVVLMEDNIMTKTIEGTLTVDKPTIAIVNAITTPEICDRENGTISLSVNSEDSTIVKYIWEGLLDTTPALSNLKAGTYRVIISDTFCVIEKTVIVKHIDGPVADFEFADNVIYNQVFSLIDKSQGTVQTWEWDMGDEHKQMGKQVSYKYPYSEDYKISLKVTDINGCIDTVSKIIHIYELKIFFPNAFSPNGDGLNDTWKPIMSDYLKEGYVLTIYDRLGQHVFHTTNTEEAWDGTINGKEAEANTVYSYHVTVKNMAGKKFEYKGGVTVVR